MRTDRYIQLDIKGPWARNLENIDKRSTTGHILRLPDAWCVIYNHFIIKKFARTSRRGFGTQNEQDKLESQNLHAQFIFPGNSFTDPSSNTIRKGFIILFEMK